MLRTMFVVAGLLAAGALTTYVALASGADATPEEREDRVLQDELPPLEQAHRLRLVHRAAHQPSAAPQELRAAPTTRLAASPPDPDQHDPEGAHARALEEDRRRFEEQYRRFSEEPVDGVWADRTVAQLKQTFAAAKLGEVAQLAGIACKSSRCAVDLKYVAPREERRERETSLRRDMQRVIADWLMGQPCGFHVPGPASMTGDAPVQRLYLDCADRRAGS